MQKQSDETIKEAPAPWQLSGKAYLCFLRATENGSHPLMIFVDYEQSPVGPYHELLFIPGYFTLDRKKYLSIERIFVSSMSSVINGRRNWGIPKDFAEFDVKYNENGIDHIIVRHQGKIFAELSFKTSSFPISIPFTTALLPKSFRTLMQRENNTTYRFCPEGSGWLHPARILKANIDQKLFPSITPKDVLFTVKISHFQMKFPKAQQN